MLVTGSARIWCTSQAVFPAEVVNDQALKFRLKVELLKGDIQDLASAL
ncbi:unnamed protein product [marine sediment metagenome]|uniref:Uncharacterized protein n=1 Tax=marine sediment metagenome TaxID=412755 RepID=X1U1K7_9ZZZZ